MRLHYRKSLALLGMLLLAGAAVLGWSHWNKREAISGPDHSSKQAGEEKTFSELPRTAASVPGGHAVRAAKVAERSNASPSPESGGGAEAEKERPRPGETIYQMSHLPKACGTYWVENPDGSYGRVAVCNPENHPGASH